MQSDLFPVLEYEAPKAFYLAIAAVNLDQFDERTWQQEMASPAKRLALASLTGADLRSVFGQFWTINTNLQTYLSWRLHQAASAETAPEPADVRSLPSAFRPLTTPPALGPEAGAALGSTNQEVNTLLAAAAFLDQNSADKARGILLMEQLLRQRGQHSDWSAPYYAAMAARASVGLGDLERSRQLVELGLQAAPDDPQLLYLTRILQREQPGAPKLSVNTEPRP
jgi:hypothetical protein